MIRILGVLALVTLVASLGLYFAGWLNLRNSENTATLEIKTGEIKQAAEQTVEEGRKLVNEATATSSNTAPATSENESTKAR